MAESLIKKLGIKPGYKLLILNAPENYLSLLGELPDGTSLATAPDGTYDFVQLFVRNAADLNQHAMTAINALKPGGILYFSYPKLSSKVESDLNRDEGWDVVRKAGWDTVRAVSIDDTWSGIRFRPAGDVKHKANRRLS